LTDKPDISLAIALLSELVAADQMIKATLSRKLPKGMELSHFSVLNHLNNSGEKNPAQLARNFHLTKGAMTNTLQRLESAGYIHVRPDWDDARRKQVSISTAGRTARDMALAQLVPMFKKIVEDLGAEEIRQALPILRDIRAALRG
jgi:DNA-binding MarR family transcriptional regulator